MQEAMKYLFSGIAAAAACYFGGQLWNTVAIKAIGPEAQLALIVFVAAVLGGLIGDKLGFKGGK